MQPFSSIRHIGRLTSSSLELTKFYKLAESRVTGSAIPGKAKSENDRIGLGFHILVTGRAGTGSVIVFNRQQLDPGEISCMRDDADW